MKHLGLIARCITGLLLFAAVLEFCARADDYLSYGAAFWKTYQWETLEMADGAGVRGRPNARYQKWKLNSLGYRGPELRAGTVRIVCFGASETFGIYESEEQEYPRQLERELNSRIGAKVFDVVNVAMVGQRISAALRRVPEIVDEVHPTYATIYPAVQHYIWLPAIKEGAPIAAAAPSSVEQPEGEFELRIVERFRNLMKMVLPGSIQTRMREWEIEAEAKKYPVMDFVPEVNVALFRTHLRQFVTVLRAAGVEPLLITHATNFGDAITEKDRDLLIAWRKFNPMLKEGGFLDMERRMNAVIRDVAKEDHVLLIDAAIKIKPGANFADYCHFTTSGASVMASLLAETLQAAIDQHSIRQSAAALKN